jgi:hypothetical protein
VDRARARISGWLAALWQPAQWDVVDDDGGEPVGLPAVARCPNCGRDHGDSDVCQACGYGYGYQPAYRAHVTAVYPPGRWPVTSPVAMDDTITDWNSARVTGAARRVTRKTIWQPPGQIQRAVGALMDEYWPKQVTCG